MPPEDQLTVIEDGVVHAEVGLFTDEDDFATRRR